MFCFLTRMLQLISSTLIVARQPYGQLLNGKELKATRPQARPSGLVPQAEDKAGAAAIEKALRDLFAEDPAPKIDGAPTPGGFRARGQMSPLSRRGLPGAGSIDQYSTPGGIESLYRGSK